MTIPLHVLILEDRDEEAEQIADASRGDAFEPRCQRIDTEDSFCRRLREKMAIVVANHSLPSLAGLYGLVTLGAHRREQMNDA